MRNRLLLIIACLFLFTSIIFFSSKPVKIYSQSGDDTLIYPNEKHFKNMKMLTHGGQNAEAYFSFDGSRLIFQSIRNGYKCDQIYSMNIDGSNVKMDSNGKGRTTCSYFYPDGKHILYSSTFLGGDDCPPQPDFSQGYVWPLYDTYDIFYADTSGNIIKQITTEKGYDAETTISPKGDKMVFTSTRNGDIDLYSMNLDGSDVKQLTYELGYDGGAYYSYDGRMIVFRASRPKTDEEVKEYKDLLAKGLVKPTILEIYVMNADGSNIRQLTNLNAASFAPYFFPDDKRVIFASNVGDPQGRTFELYAVNIDGTGLERITYGETFASFAMFSMDGKKFVFCSNRFGSVPHETNVFICDWVN